MASTKEYLDFLLEQLSDLEEVSFRAMMGEYILYYRGKVVGGIYDDRFLVKPTRSALMMMPEAERELPYAGAKEMLLVDDVDNKEFLTELLEAMFPELPAPKKRSERKSKKLFYLCRIMGIMRLADSDVLEPIINHLYGGMYLWRLQSKAGRSR